MTMRTTFSIAIPAVALLLIVLVLGQPRWLGTPWLVIGPPMRALLAVLFCGPTAGAGVVAGAGVAVERVVEPDPDPPQPAITIAAAAIAASPRNPRVVLPLTSIVFLSVNEVNGRPNMLRRGRLRVQSAFTPIQIRMRGNTF